ncbi:MAG: DNA-binding protein [Gallionellales bacterium CG_4_10_14_3_um_filter_54_96]|nr:MAG: DNA-binding protein [Gallionellales bacterium CG03_land_8_20_14_0_80_55_15]PIV92104.1 MAG: DNA-binding protein [Gallionellales bacterium CG17_big_fil_post_rev_8_21_14_2_50_54_146]PIX04431.1 MAG: DNA-binding protein [Gallionellales bacterium CG_4_8_14_3_um_filter_54_18]PIY06985.1 MAG: DNA-binding protein [Gallionellales bacterium CG_4_10_14_3_um_filter_54_96]HCJ51594.1 DNA-binding protein [Gallionella sp.]
MSGIKYLLDTNIIIGLLERQPVVLELFSARQVKINECAYASITRIELLSFPAISFPEKQAIESVLARMVYLAITPAIEDETIAFRRVHKTKLPDSIIAATSRHARLELLTLDKKLADKL